MRRKKTIRVLIIVICLYLAFTTIQGTVKLLSSGEKVAGREAKLAALQRQKEDLLRKEKQVGSKEFVEKTAYDELGLSKPGEKVVIIPKELLADKTPKIVVNNEKNWELWRDLLF